MSRRTELLFDEQMLTYDRDVVEPVVAVDSEIGAYCNNGDDVWMFRDLIRTVHPREMQKPSEHTFETMWISFATASLSVVASFATYIKLLR